MKIKFVALILIVLLCLTSCENHNTVVDNKPDKGLVVMSPNIIESKVKSTAQFAIQLGIGNQTGFLPRASMTVKVSSPDLVIIAPDGSKNKNEYTCEYVDFGSGRFDFFKDSDFKDWCRYIETYVFYFEENPENQTGEIFFEICSEVDKSKAPQYYAQLGETRGDTLKVYYEVKNGKIRIYSENKDSTSFLKLLLDEICEVFDR